MSKINSILFNYLKSDYTNELIPNYIAEKNPMNIDINVTLDPPNTLVRYPISNITLLLYLNGVFVSTMNYYSNSNDIPFPISMDCSFLINEDISTLLSKKTTSLSITYIAYDTVGQSETNSITPINVVGTNKIRYYNSGEFKYGFMKVYVNGTWNIA